MFLVCDQAIHIRILCLRTKSDFLASIMYGFNTIVQIRPLWSELQSFGDYCGLPWLILGDFNTVLSQSKKKGGLNVTNYQTKDFVDCVASLGLTDLRYVVCSFTWMSPSVCSKLDRVLVNSSWMSSNLDGIAEFVASSCVSDHALIIVSLPESRVKKVKPFKFFNMWTLSEDFLDIVEKNWFFRGHGTLQYKLKQLLNGIKQPLKSLNRVKFSHISSRASIA